MDRRRFLLTSLAGALAGPLAAEAQQVGRVYRIGFLGHLLRVAQATESKHSERVYASLVTSRERISLSSSDGPKGG